MYTGEVKKEEEKLETYMQAFLREDGSLDFDAVKVSLCVCMCMYVCVYVCVRRIGLYGSYMHTHRHTHTDAQVPKREEFVRKLHTYALKHTHIHTHTHRCLREKNWYESYMHTH